ncbi:DUF6901 family protein [Alloalcanivorax sp. C16-2]|uniref:DUF6901 family protein n=1 Tax=Alloalcanivorax TaxID=3020832 RepID=UPI00193155BE|nr:hypothetical protein [Alloalcanivorax marinus]MBL7250814.1 hypothetical protein [Alloalcanivorax marinus]
MPPEIRYFLHDGDTDAIQVRLTLSPEHHGLVVPDDYEAPPWARLEHCQCSHCPLDPARHRDCPIARNLAYTLPHQDLGESFREIDLRVEDSQREYRTHTTVQRALSSLFGLVCALSDCPHTRFLRPMALFHLPVSTETETLARTVGFYLLGRYLATRSGEERTLDLDDLNRAYRDLGELNRCFVQRFRQGGSDGPINAMILLHVLSQDVNWELKDQLDALANLFTAATGDSGGRMQ